MRRIEGPVRFPRWLRYLSPNGIEGLRPGVHQVAHRV